jgi:hypothetical protein
MEFDSDKFIAFAKRHEKVHIKLNEVRFYDGPVTGRASVKWNRDSSKPQEESLK